MAKWILGGLVTSVFMGTGYVLFVAVGDRVSSSSINSNMLLYIGELLRN